MTRWIPILVRLEDYAEITALVATREAERPSEDPADARGAEVATANAAADSVLAALVPWEVEDLARLAEGSTLTTQRWTAALDQCTQVPGQWLTTSEIARRTGLGVNEWRDAARKLPRHLEAHYPHVPVGADGRAQWPLAARTVPGTQEVSWAITAEMARRWTQARSR